MTRLGMMLAALAMALLSAFAPLSWGIADGAGLSRCGKCPLERGGKWVKARFPMACCR